MAPTRACWSWRGGFAAASLIAVITTILRRRSGHQDLLGTQVREMEARAVAAAYPDAETRLPGRGHPDRRRPHARSRLPCSRHDAAPAEVTSDALTSVPSAADAASPGAVFPDAAAVDRSAQDPTAPLDGWPSEPGGKDDAMADAFAWLRLAALVESGQREQAVDLLSTTMTISADEAEVLVDGLNDAGDELPPD